MFASTRNWIRRNRTPIAIGAGVVGTAYFAGQYVLGKISEARQRMRDDSIAKENLKRRFTQNQEDCLYTTLALLPTATDNILRAIPVEDVLGELQARKSEKMGRNSAAPSELAPTENGTASEVGGSGSVAGTEEGSVRESFVHASREFGGSGDGGSSQGASGDGQTGERAKVLSGKSKSLLWEEVKIQSITRALTLIYVLPLLTLLTRIQLNLLGRRTYLSSVVSLASPFTQNPSSTQTGAATDGFPESPPSPISLENHDDDREDYYGNDFDTNRKYLTFSWWLLHRGWIEIRGAVEAAVVDVFGGLNPRENVPFEQLAELILEVRRRVEGKDEEARRERRWLSYLLPPGEEEEALLRESGMLDAESPLAPTDAEPEMRERPVINSTLRRLLDETSDLIDSPTFTHVLTLLLDAAFSLLIDGKVASEAYKIPPQQPALASAFAGAEPRVMDVTDELEVVPTVKLASILPVFTKQAASIGRGGEESLAAVGSLQGVGLGTFGGEAPGIAEANEYLAAIERVRDLEAFAAVVYSSNFEFEGLNEEDDNGGGQSGSSGTEKGKTPSAREIEESLVDVGAEVQGKLESAWEKAQRSSAGV